MDFTRITVIGLLVVSLTFISGTARPQADTSGKQTLVQGRLTSDLSRLGNQLAQLNQTVNQLQTELSQLKTENQRQKIRIDALERLVNRLQNRLASGNAQQDEKRVDAPAKSQSPEPTQSNGDNVWIAQPDITYTIRRTPLDHEITYVTTDDTILTRLAHRYYRNSGLWEEIYRVNSDKLPSPNVIPPGIRLRLPPISELN